MNLFQNKQVSFITQGKLQTNVWYMRGLQDPWRKQMAQDPESAWANAKHVQCAVFHRIYSHMIYNSIFFDLLNIFVSPLNSLYHKLLDYVMRVFSRTLRIRKRQPSLTFDWYWLCVYVLLHAITVSHVLVFCLACNSWLYFTDTKASIIP